MVKHLRYVLVVGFLGCAGPSAAEEPPRAPGTVGSAVDLPVCNGFDPLSGSFHTPLLGAEQSEVNCPAGWYVLTFQAQAKQFRKSKVEGFIFKCCPGPGDLLVERHVYEATRCPEGYLVTGQRIVFDPLTTSQPSWRSPAASRVLRCTALSPRYQLEPAAQPLLLTPLTSLGFEWSWLLSWLWPSSEPRAIRASRFRLPAAIRFAVGRVSEDIIENEWCLGEPFGSPVVALPGRECSGEVFRSISYRGIGQNPPAGTPVKMFADCIAVEGADTAHPRCIPPPSRRE